LYALKIAKIAPFSGFLFSKGFQSIKNKTKGFPLDTEKRKGSFLSPPRARASFGDSFITSLDFLYIKRAPTFILSCTNIYLIPRQHLSYLAPTFILSFTNMKIKISCFCL